MSEGACWEEVFQWTGKEAKTGKEVGKWLNALYAGMKLYEMCETVKEQKVILKTFVL